MLLAGASKEDWLAMFLLEDFGSMALQIDATCSV